MANPVENRIGTGTGGGPRDLGSLLEALGNDNGLARQRARRALVDIGRPAVPGLLKQLGSANPDTRWEAAKALSEIPDPAATPALVQALDDRTFGVRWLAAEALIGLHRAALVPVLKALVDHPQSVWLREGARHVLHSLARESTSDELKPVLKALEGSHPAEEAPVAAEILLQAIAGPRRV